MLKTIVGSLILTGAVFGQAATPQLEFEVASVRPAAPRTQGEITGMRGGPGSTDPERVSFRSATLQNLLLRAFGLQFDRLSGPDWLPATDIDIAAKLPPGTSTEQFNVMLQNLLVDRFKIISHHENKTFAVYELTVAKGGLKLKPSSAEPNPPPGAQGPTPADPAALQAQVQQQLQQLTVQVRSTSNTLDADGFPPLPEGNRPFLRGMTVNGRMLVNARGQNMAGIVRALQSGLGGGARVVDKTGLTGLYDFKLQYAARGNAAAPGQTPAGALDAAEPAPEVPEAAQSQLGLKLEKGTTQFDVLVIDHIEKTPTDN